MSENKMEDFIKRRLTDQTPAEDGWNVPSDDLFNQAKVHFPKEDVKKKRWFWLPLMFGVVIGAALTAYFLYPGSNLDLEEMTAAHQEIETKAKNDDISSTLTNKLNQTSDAIKNENINSREKEQIKTTNAVSSSNLSQEIDNSQKLDNNISEIEAGQSNSTFVEKNESQIIVRSIGTPSINNAIDIPNSSPIGDVISNPIGGAIIEAGEGINTANKISVYKNRNIPVVVESTKNQNKTNALEASTTKRDAINVSEENNVAGTLGGITPLSLLSSPLAFRGSILPCNAPTEIHTFRPTLRIQETGIGYEERVVGALRLINLNDDNGTDHIAAAGKYFNTNFHYTKWFAKKWSVSTGLKYSKLDLIVDFSVLDTMETDDLDVFVAQELNEAIESRSSNTTSNEENIQVELLDGYQVMAGDVLRIEGDVALRLRALQLPVLLNYHIYKKRSEFRFGLGASIDYIQIRQSDVELFLYKEDTLINKPTLQKEDQENTLGYAIYAQTGYRYYVNKNINIGLTANVDILEPIFSGLEFGLFYQWSR